MPLIGLFSPSFRLGKWYRCAARPGSPRAAHESGRRCPFSHLAPRGKFPAIYNPPAPLAATAALLAALKIKHPQYARSLYFTFQEYIHSRRTSFRLFIQFTGRFSFLFFVGLKLRPRGCGGHKKIVRGEKRERRRKRRERRFLAFEQKQPVVTLFVCS